MSCNNAANRNLCLGIKRAEYLMKKRSGALSAANFNAAMAALKGGKNRRHGGGNNNGPSIKYFEKLMANRAAARNAVNVRGNPVKSRKNRKASRKASRKNRKGSRKNRRNTRRNM